MTSAGPGDATAAVEAALFEHAAVADCAVLAAGPGRQAVVVLRPGAKIGVDELARHLSDRLEPPLVPDTYWFRRQRLPRGPSGDVDRQTLAAELAGRTAGEPRRLPPEIPGGLAVGP